MLGAAVNQRLATKVPALEGRIGTAAQFSAALHRGKLPQVTPAAFVLPLGLRGKAADAVAGMFRQGLDRMLGIVLVVRAASDPLGEKATDELAPLIEQTVEAFAGWAPDEAIGVYRLGRGELVSMNGGACTYQLDFILDDQLRITP